MNIGERNELLFKILLVKLRDERQLLFNEKILSVGMDNFEYQTYPKNQDIKDLYSYSDDMLTSFGLEMGINKAPANAKADVYINHIGVSLKSTEADPPAVVNHTRRTGFEFACSQIGCSIEELDSIIDDYWVKRMEGEIAEDIKNSDPRSPFKVHKAYLSKIIKYFMFDGSGTRLSTNPAEFLIEFGSPFDRKNFKKYSKEDAVDAIWSHLIFSVRAKKGMPKDYNPTTYNKYDAESVRKWVRYINGEYRGALHIRVK